MSIHDPIFGDMNYNYLWEKEERCTLWGAERTLRIEAEAEHETDTTLSPKQQQAYRQSKSLLDNEKEACLAALCAYCTANFGTSATAEEFLQRNRPISLYFALNGHWGLLFDSRDDEEHGIALMHADGQWSAGSQDILI